MTFLLKLIIFTAFSATFSSSMKPSQECSSASNCPPNYSCAEWPPGQKVCLESKALHELCKVHEQCTLEDSNSECKVDADDLGRESSCVCAESFKKDEMSGKCVDRRFCRVDTDCIGDFEQFKCVSETCEQVPSRPSTLLPCIVFGSFGLFLVTFSLIGCLRSRCRSSALDDLRPTYSTPTQRAIMSRLAMARRSSLRASRHRVHHLQDDLPPPYSIVTSSPTPTFPRVSYGFKVTVA